MSLAALVDHQRQPVGDDIRPVGEGALKTCDAVEKDSETIADRKSKFFAVNARQRRDDVDRGMRDQRRVMICQDRPIVLEEIEKIGHLFEIRRYVRVVPPEVYIV